MKLEQLEIICKEFNFLNASDQKRSDLKKAFHTFQETEDIGLKCELVTETILKLISNNDHLLNSQQRIELNKFILNYLTTATNPKNIELVEKLITLFAVITRSGWNDKHEEVFLFRNIVTSIKPFTQSSTEDCLIGIQLLSQVVNEFGKIPKLNSRDRKIIKLFQNSELFEIYLLTYSLLNQNFDYNDPNQLELIKNLLGLIKKCFAFDFLGLLTNELPLNWKLEFLEFKSLNFFFNFYHILPERLELKSLALSCLAQMALIDCTTDEEWVEFLTLLFNGIKSILLNQENLIDPLNQNEFCRLLYNLSFKFRLIDILEVEFGLKMYELISKYTVEIFQKQQMTEESLKCLLNFWFRPMCAVTNLDETKFDILKPYISEIVSAYITFRLDIKTVNRERPLIDEQKLSHEFECLSCILRYDYNKTYKILIEFFDRTFSLYQQKLQVAEEQDEVIVVKEQLMWLLYIISSVLCGSLSFTNTEEHDSFDGELICRGFQFIKCSDGTHSTKDFASLKLEIAILNFLSDFRLLYIFNDERFEAISPKIKTLGFNDVNVIIETFIKRIIKNLNYWSTSLTIIDKTLELFSRLIDVYSCSEMFLKLNDIQSMLSDHSEYFPFLDVLLPNEMGYRTKFYICLSRLIIMDGEMDYKRFQSFISPLAVSFDKIDHELTSVKTKGAIIRSEISINRLTADLIGILEPFNLSESYDIFFEWIYPKYTSVLLRAFEFYDHDPEVTGQILKFFIEFVNNMYNRIRINVKSPNGVFLLRLMSKIFCTYGSGILLDVNISKEHKLENISLCFQILRNTFNGGYVNFGVLQLYGEECLNNSVDMFMKLLLTIPRSDILGHEGLLNSYYGLLEAVTDNEYFINMNFSSKLGRKVFPYIFLSLIEDVNAYHTNSDTLNNCYINLDHILTYAFQRIGQENQNDVIVEVCESNSDCLKQTLRNLLHVIMFEPCNLEWSLSRPLLILVLMYGDYLNELREHYVRIQLVEKQPLMEKAFENLMDGVKNSLLIKNRDRFSSNVHKFGKNLFNSGELFVDDDE